MREGRGVLQARPRGETGGLAWRRHTEVPSSRIAGWRTKIGRPRNTVHRALKRLVDAGVLTQPGAMPGRGMRGTHLYAPVPVVRHLVALPDPIRNFVRNGGVGLHFRGVVWENVCIRERY